MAINTITNQGKYITNVNKRIVNGSSINPIWEGLISYYRFDETSGTAPQDSKGSNHLVNNNCAITDGKNNKCLDISTGDSLYCPTPASSFDFTKSTPFSFSFWYKYTTNFTTRGILSRQQQTPVRRGYEFFTSSGTFYCWFFGNATTNGLNVLRSGVWPNNSTWYNTIFTYDGSGSANGMKLYVNGSNLSLSVGKNNLNAFDINIGDKETQIGCYDGRAYPIGGLFDEFAIWNRALSSTEVTTLYNSGSGIFY